MCDVIDDPLRRKLLDNRAHNVLNCSAWDTLTCIDSENPDRITLAHTAPFRSVKRQLLYYIAPANALTFWGSFVLAVHVRCRTRVRQCKGDPAVRRIGHSGAKLNRPGLDDLRDRAALAEFDTVLITEPDRLARNYVHQVVVIEELGN